MNIFEKFVSDHPATLILLLTLAIFVSISIFAGIKIGFLILSIILTVTMIAFAINRFGN
jgi:hypothetical protein